MLTTIRSLSLVKKRELIQNILMFFLRCFCYFLFISQNNELPIYIVYKKN